jgi:hypothetical protein
MCIAVEQEVEERKRKKSEEIQETGRVVQANRSTFQEIKGAERERVRESSREREKEKKLNTESSRVRESSPNRVEDRGNNNELQEQSNRTYKHKHTHTSKWPETALVSAEWPVAL